MNDFRQAFREVAESATAELVVPAKIAFSTKKDRLVIPKQSESGFELEFECTDVGFMPMAEGWHSGFWDVTAFEPDALKEELTEFIASVVSDAVLEVHYSNKRPYKWVLYYQSGGERVVDETGLLFFNWFGRRSVQRLSNDASAT